MRTGKVASASEGARPMAGAELALVRGAHLGVSVCEHSRWTLAVIVYFWLFQSFISGRVVRKRCVCVVAICGKCSESADDRRLFVGSSAESRAADIRAMEEKSSRSQLSSNLEPHQSSL